MTITSFNEFQSRGDLAEALAGALAEKLTGAIAVKGKAVLAVSGGSTPKQLFNALSGQQIDWQKVLITLVDDRCVPADNERSNEKLVRDNLLKGPAAAACFLPLPQQSDTRFSPPLPLDVAILGMGTDGHTASFFPDGNHLQEATDPRTDAKTISMEAPGAHEARITMALPLLVQAHHLVLHIEGDDKRAVFETALQDGPADNLPIRHVLRHPDTNIHVYWAL